MQNYHTEPTPNVSGADHLCPGSEARLDVNIRQKGGQEWSRKTGRFIDIAAEDSPASKQGTTQEVEASPLPQLQPLPNGQVDKYRYLLVPKPTLETVSNFIYRPLPCGRRYDRHTVASNVLLAVGVHPWLAPLNDHWEDLLDVNIEAKPLNADHQHQRDLVLQGQIDKKRFIFSSG